MDPNETLRLLRQAIDESIEADMRHDREDEMDALLSIREHVENLDRWIRRGGVLPYEWQPYPRVNAAGDTVWACCESSIGPLCEHRRQELERYTRH